MGESRQGAPIANQVEQVARLIVAIKQRESLLQSSDADPIQTGLAEARLPSMRQMKDEMMKALSTEHERAAAQHMADIFMSNPELINQPEEPEEATDKQVEPTATDRQAFIDALMERVERNEDENQ